MNDRKSQTGARAPTNVKKPWYVRLLGIAVIGLTKRQIKDMATAKLGRSKHAEARKPHAIRHTPGRSARHVRPMGRGMKL